MADGRPRPGQAAMERFVKDEISRRFRSPSRFFKRTGIERTTYYRVVADSPAIGSASFRMIEGALDLPRYTLDYIADCNVEALERAGLDADQLRVILEHLPEAPETRSRRRTAGE